MELYNISIEGFRRFESKVNLQLSGKLVSLVGANEAGKSSILKAVAYCGNDDEIDQSDRTYESDVETEIVCSFFLSEGEARSAKLEKRAWFRVHKYADGGREYSLDPKPLRDMSLRKQTVSKLKALTQGARFKEAQLSGVITTTSEQLKNLVEHLSKHQGLLEGNTVQELDGLMSDLSDFNDNDPAYIHNAKSAIEELISFEADHDPEQEAIDLLAPMVPKILIFGSEDRAFNVPYNIANAINADEDEKKPPCKPLRELVSATGLDLKKLFGYVQSNNNAQLRGLIESANDKLRELSRGFWSQSDACLYFELNGRMLDVLVQHDEGFEPEYKYNNFRDRSDGYRQFIALQIFSLIEKIDGAILLVDEIEQHLHYDAQADLIQHLGTEPEIGKVIYTTHSAGCLPEDLGLGVRLVSWDDNDPKRSKVINRFWHEGDSSGFKPLLFGMGATTLSFFPTRKAAIGEGITEVLLLPTLFREATGLTSLGFQIVHGLSSVNLSGLQMLDLVNDGTVFIHDNDASGERLARELKNAKVSAQNIIPIGTKAGVVTIEDLIDSRVWRNAVTEYRDKFYPKDTKLYEGHVPDFDRIAKLEKTYRRAKVDIAYNVLRQKSVDPSLEIIAKKHKASLKKNFAKISKALDINN